MRGRQAKRHDCGKYGMLTAKEIIHLSGKSESAIYRRVLSGVNGEELVHLPRKNRSRSEFYTDSLSIDPECSKSAFIACKIAHMLRKTDGAPTVVMLCNRLGMSRATACRWRRAWLDASGDAS